MCCGRTVRRRFAGAERLVLDALFPKTDYESRSESTDTEPSADRRPMPPTRLEPEPEPSKKSAFAFDPSAIGRMPHDPRDDDDDDGTAKRRVEDYGDDKKSRAGPSGRAFSDASGPSSSGRAGPVIMTPPTSHGSVASDDDFGDDDTGAVRKRSRAPDAELYPSPEAVLGSPPPYSPRERHRGPDSVASPSERVSDLIDWTRSRPVDGNSGRG